MIIIEKTICNNTILILYVNVIPIRKLGIKKSRKNRKIFLNHKKIGRKLAKGCNKFVCEFAK